MPAAEDLSPYRDDVDLNQQALEEESPPPPTSSKRNKKKKNRKNVEPLYRAAEEEDTPFEQAIAASSPNTYGFRLQDELDAPLEDEPTLPPPSTPSPEVRDADDVAVAESTKRPSKAVAVSSPALAVTSPRLAAARPAATSVTPPSRPTSLHGPHQYHGPAMNYRASSTTAQLRRESNTSHTSPRPHFVEPVAPPHMTQPHYYGLPEWGGFNFGQKKDQTAKTAGSGGYCCCFDSFADSGDLASSKKAKNALLVGSEGGLEVFRVLPNKFEVVGRLEGLRGSVIGAKILPHVDVFDPTESRRPLVAVIVHGPDTRPVPGSGDEANEPTHYQTIVEVYSLQSQEYLTTLYCSTLAAIEQPGFGQISSLPAPIGDLILTANGKYVVVASGKSGEIFVFSNAQTSVNTGPSFRFIGKYWTTVQSSLDSQSRPSSSSDASQTAEELDEKPGIPIVALSQRWLAVVSPSNSAHISIQGAPLLVPHSPNPPGLASHVAPPQPPITCDIAGVDEEGAWSRIRRQATQSVVKYSQKGIEMGWQGWKELTNPTSQPGSYHGRTSSKDAQFPPTNAPPEDPRRITKEPAVVSIIDLETLLDAEEQKPKYPPAPIATFALDEGCNFLSFSSNGLRLLTVSQKGEVSTIWDLSQVNHGTAAYGSNKEDEITHGPCVKQIHRITRSSQSVVVEAAWSRDDDCLALLTTHGTVHLHEVPTQPVSRKRKRRSTTSAPVPEKAEATVSLSQGMSPPSSNGFLGSIKSGLQQWSTQVNTIRSQNPVASLGIPSFAGFKETAANAGHAGGKALAKGFSQGYSAAKGGASGYWHSEDNKIRHKALHDHTDVGALRWIKRQSGTLLAVACGGTVHLHPVSRIERMAGGKLVSGLKHDKYGKKHFDLPHIRTSADASDKRPKRPDGCTGAGPHGFWSLGVSLAPDEKRLSDDGTNMTSSQANEVETNPPYCPFHVDSRVNVFAFQATAGSSSQINLLDDLADSPPFHTQGRGLGDEEPWVFGEPLPPSININTQDDLDLRDEFHQDGLNDSDLEEAAQQVESKLTVHTVSETGGSGGDEEIRINTRRTKGEIRDADMERGDDGFDMMADEDDEL